MSSKEAQLSGPQQLAGRPSAAERDKIQAIMDTLSKVRHNQYKSNRTWMLSTQRHAYLSQTHHESQAGCLGTCCMRSAFVHVACRAAFWAGPARHMAFVVVVMLPGTRASSA